jgi:hypothetical protein
MTLDERLIAYVDGELAGDDLKLFEAEMAADPRLAGEVEKHRTMAARLAMAYSPVIDEKVPGRLKAAARGKTAARSGARARAGVWPWAAVAASLVVGVAAGIAGGHFAWPRPDGALVISDNGRLVAGGALKTALTDQLGAQQGPLQTGLSFKTRAGRYCRTFQSAADGMAGVACRHGEDWVMQTTTAFSPAKTAPAYRTAASETPAAVLSAVDGLIAGPPLDAAAEQAARARGWK